MWVQDLLLLLPDSRAFNELHGACQSTGVQPGIDGVFKQRSPGRGHDNLTARLSQLCPVTRPRQDGKCEYSMIVGLRHNVFLPGSSRRYGNFANAGLGKNKLFD